MEENIRKFRKEYPFRYPNLLIIKNLIESFDFGDKKEYMNICFYHLYDEVSYFEIYKTDENNIHALVYPYFQIEVLEDCFKLFFTDSSGRTITFFKMDSYGFDKIKECLNKVKKA